MKIFVSVRNWVAINPTLPGIAEGGITKLTNDIPTSAEHGK